MLTGLSPLAREARAWTFEQARNLLARLLKARLNGDGERDLASSLIISGKIGEALATLPALTRPFGRGVPAANYQLLTFNIFK